MKRVTFIDELHPGDTIVSISNGEMNTLQFVCIHPGSNDYSLFLNENYDGVPKFYNKRLTYECWYHFNDTKEDWLQIYDMMIEQFKKEIDHLMLRKKRLSSAKPSTL